VLSNLREVPFLLNKEVLLGRLEDCLATVPTLLCMSMLEWKAWQWPRSLSFLKSSKSSTKAVYEYLSYKKDWYLHLNKIWRLAWTKQRWAHTLMNVWKSKDLEQSKMFVIRVMLGILPMAYYPLERSCDEMNK